MVVPIGVLGSVIEQAINVHEQGYLLVIFDLEAAQDEAVHSGGFISSVENVDTIMVLETLAANLKSRLEEDPIFVASLEKEDLRLMIIGASKGKVTDEDMVNMGAPQLWKLYHDIKHIDNKEK